MSSQNLTYQDLLQIVEWIKSSDQFGEFHLKMGDVEVHLRRRSTSPAPPSPPVISEAQPPTATRPPLPVPPQPNSQAEHSPLPAEARNGHTAPVAEAADNISPRVPGTRRHHHLPYGRDVLSGS